MNVYPPVLTNRDRQKIEAASGLTDDSQKSQPSSSESDQNIGEHTVITTAVESSESHQDNNRNEELNNFYTATAVVNDESDSSKKYFYKYPPKEMIREEDENDRLEQASCCHSDSDFVENDWSDSESNSNKQNSKEAQEAELQNKYHQGISRLNKGQMEKAASTFSSILLHPQMQKYHLFDWEALDWNQIANDPSHAQKMHSNMAKIYFNVNLAMACIVENSIPFFMQALSIRPDYKDLWYICGQIAIRKNDWRSARICFSHCDNEFRALESLLMVHYMSSKFLECTSLLLRLFALHPEHLLGQVVRSLIAESGPCWMNLHEKCFRKEILDFVPSEKQKEKVLQCLEQFKRNGQNAGTNSRSKLFQGAFINER